MSPKEADRPAYEVFASAADDKKPAAKYDKFVSAGKTLDGVGNLDEKEAVKEPHPNEGRALFEVLQEAKTKKQEEWEKDHNPFQPPKALDEEDATFLEETEQAERTKQHELKEEVDKQMASFRSAKQKFVYHALEEDVPDEALKQPPSIPIPPKDDHDRILMPKRLSVVKVITKPKQGASAESQTKTKAPPPSALLQGLASYGSEDDSSSEAD
ncbi:hypothetical protein NDN08_000241 [Rhodosorus marinus]|uniref:FAM192A/Fyv6 N-terminal domain-containing protein n=1 Tax=Rhodosorus marinus TaxID=101924 RepID=A0AAV8UER3_9RHOD|nr:hypothetical protein NDN08_000241 [Rhodosorus marinus]